MITSTMRTAEHNTYHNHMIEVSIIHALNSQTTMVTTPVPAEQMIMISVWLNIGGERFP